MDDQGNSHSDTLSTVGDHRVFRYKAIRAGGQGQRRKIGWGREKGTKREKETEAFSSGKSIFLFSLIGGDTGQRINGKNSVKRKDSD